MLLFICLFLLYCIIVNLISVYIMWIRFHKEENKEELRNDLKNYSDTLKKEGYNAEIEDVLIFFYLVGAFLGFIIMPISIIKTLMGNKRNDR